VTEGRVIPIEGHVRRGNSHRTSRRRTAAPPPKARRGRGGIRRRTPSWLSARWRWLLAIGAAVIVGAAIAGRISRPLKPPRIFDASAFGGQSPDAADRSFDGAPRDRRQDSGVAIDRERLSGDSLEARQADGIAAAIERRRLPIRLPR
jgi:hypothetical protein